MNMHAGVYFDIVIVHSAYFLNYLIINNQMHNSINKQLDATITIY